MFKLQHSNTPILQHSKAHGYVPDVQLILAAMDLSSYYQLKTHLYFNP
jgi:hypothetical protein